MNDKLTQAVETALELLHGVRGKDIEDQTKINGARQIIELALTRKPQPPTITSIEILDLTPRSSNALKAAGIDTVEKLVKNRSTDLLRIANFGRFSLNDVTAALRKINLTLL